MLDRIYAVAIEGVVRYQPCGPVNKVVVDVLHRLVQIRKTGDPTVLYGGLVAVVYVTVRMIVGGLIEWGNAGEIRIPTRTLPDVVENDIHHYPDVRCVARCDHVS